MKNNVNHYTTIEQSKKLIEAGLDPNTADMNYRYCICKCIDGEPKEDWLLGTCGIFEECPDEQIPCWSLGRLIELMPESVNWKKLVVTKPYIAYVNLEEWVYSGHSYFEACDDTLIENAVTTICWLLENNYIKKGETK